MKTVLAILLVVLVLLQVRLWAGAGSMADIVRLENEIAEQNEENAGLQARNSILMEEVGDLRNGLDSIEERARNELGLIRQGETFYLIVEDDPNAAPQPETQLVDESLIRPRIVPEEVAPEPPPEIAREENPYLDVFRDGEDAPETPAPEAGQTAGQ
jgi:cell division protein FtsB